MDLSFLIRVNISVFSHSLLHTEHWALNTELIYFRRAGFSYEDDRCTGLGRLKKVFSCPVIYMVKQKLKHTFYDKKGSQIVTRETLLRIIFDLLNYFYSTSLFWTPWELDGGGGGSVTEFPVTCFFFNWRDQSSSLKSLPKLALWWDDSLLNWNRRTYLRSFTGSYLQTFLYRLFYV